MQIRRMAESLVEDEQSFWDVFWDKPFERELRTDRASTAHLYALSAFPAACFSSAHCIYSGRADLVTWMSSVIYCMVRLAWLRSARTRNQSTFNHGIVVIPLPLSGLVEMHSRRKSVCRTIFTHDKRCSLIFIGFLTCSLNQNYLSSLNIEKIN